MVVQYLPIWMVSWLFHVHREQRKPYLGFLVFLLSGLKSHEFQIESLCCVWKTKVISSSFSNLGGIFLCVFVFFGLLCFFLAAMFFSCLRK